MKKLKKLTKKQRKQLDTLFGNVSLVAKADHIIRFISSVSNFLIPHISSFEKHNGIFANTDINNSCFEIAQKGYPPFWGNLMRINGEDYWKKRLIADDKESYEMLKPYEVEIINAFLDSKGNASQYIEQIKKAHNTQKKLEENSIPLFSAKSENSIVDINWQAYAKKHFWSKGAVVKIKLTELTKNYIEVNIVYNSTHNKSYKCTVDVKKNLEVILKSENDNGKILQCIIDGKDKLKRTAKLAITLWYKKENINIDQALLFENRDIFHLSTLGIISHLSDTLKRYLPNYKKSFVDQEMAYYFDQVSKHIVTNHSSPANTLLGSRIKALSVIPYAFYFAGLFILTTVVLCYPTHIKLITASFISIVAYVFLAENILFVALLKNAHKIENNKSAIEKDKAIIAFVIQLILLGPVIPFIGLFYYLRVKIAFNYYVAFFRKRNNILIRRLISLGLNVMPWIHVVRKKWLFKTTIDLLYELSNKDNTQQITKPMAVSIGSGFDWLMPFLSTNRELNNCIFAETDSKSIISIKSQILKTKKLFINDTFETKVSFLPANITKQGIKPVLNFHKEKQDQLNGEKIPLILIHDGYFCYQSQTTISLILRQLKKATFPVFIIGDWELYNSKYNFEPELDKGLFKLFKDHKQKRDMEENHAEIPKEKYQGKFHLNEFLEYINKYGLKIIDPDDTNILKNCDEALAKELLDYNKERINKKYPWPLSSVYKHLNIPTVRNASTSRNMGYFMVLANKHVEQHIGDKK